MNLTSGQNNRFSDPRWNNGHGEYIVLYLAMDYCVPFREVVTREVTFPILDVILEEFRLCEVRSNRNLRLVDITGAGLTWIGADARLSCGHHQVSQLWSLEFWRYDLSIDGIYYRSRLDPSRYCVALYRDRTLDRHLQFHQIGTNLAELNDELDDILQEYRYEYEPSEPSQDNAEIS
jgi:hypothetical protein